jgi:hypothetical protein
MHAQLTAKTVIHLTNGWRGRAQLPVRLKAVRNK